MICLFHVGMLVDVCTVACTIYPRRASPQFKEGRGRRVKATGGTI